MLNNDSGAGLLRHFKSNAVTQSHGAVAEGWVKSLGFTYLSAKNKREFDDNLKHFISRDIKEPMFFEIFS